MTPDPSEGSPPEPATRLRPLSPGAITAWAVVGLVAGWSLRRLVTLLGGTAPLVTWLQVAIPFFVAAVLGVVARATWTALQQRRGGLDSSRAVNRLVLARACALVGALVAGGYAGYAVSWLGLDAELATQRSLRAGLAAVGGAAMVAAAVTLERACRVREDEEDA